VARSRVRTPKQAKSCHERALGLLAVRPRSRRELQHRLRHAGFEHQEVEEVLERLEGVGLIDDAAFARQLAEHQLGSRMAGRRSVERALAAKGVSPDTTRVVLADAAGSEEDRALALASSRAGRLAGVEPAKAFTRLSSLLVRRGYDGDVARRAARRALQVDGSED
jgi:regulatory protein